MIKGAFRFSDKPLSVEVVPSGILPLDLALGVGGFPLGRTVEIYGAESSGKTTLCQTLVAQAQAQGLECAYIDVEHALDRNYMEVCGVNLDDLWIIQPDDAEGALNAIDGFVRGGVKVVILDSVAALVPRAELEGETGDAHVGLQARLMGQTLRRISPLVATNKALVVFCNQLRADIGGFSRFGTPKVTPGGNALKYAASVRLELKRRQSIKEGSSFVGDTVHVSVRKNKVSPPLRGAEFRILYNVGVVVESEALVDVAIAAGIVQRSGAWYNFVGQEDKYQGKTSLVESVGDVAAFERRIREALWPT